MPDVTLPDGSIATFPDEMPQDQIVQVIRNHLASAAPATPSSAPSAASPAADAAAWNPEDQVGGAGGEMARPAEVAGSGLLRGGAQLVGLPGDIERLARAGTILPSSQDTVGGLTRGMADIGVPLATPQTPGERYINAAAEGVGSTLPLALIPGVGEAGMAARAGLGAVQGAAMGAGGEAGRELAPNSPALGTLAGALAGGGAAGMALGGAGRLAAYLAGTAEDPLAAYKALDITPRLAGDVTQNPTLQALQTTAMRSPGGPLAQHALAATTDEFGAAAEKTAARLDPASPALPATTLQSAGQTLQDQARQWLTKWRGDQQNAWDAVGAKIPDGTPVDMTSVTTALRNTQAAMPNMPATAKLLTDPVFDQLSQSIASDIAAGGGGNALPWADVRALQQRVGTNLESSLVAGDPAAAQWKQLYAALADATGDTAMAHGAGAEYAAARNLTSSGHNYIDSVLNRVINSKNPAQNTITPEAAAGFALGGTSRGGTVVQQIRDQMPDAADALGAYKLRSMASAKPFGQSAAGDAASPNSFLTGLNQMSPEAKAALFPDPQTTQDLGNLATVAGSMRSTYQKLGNPSGTGGALLHAAPGVAAATGAVEGGREGWNEGGLRGALMGALGGATAGGLIGYAPGYALANLTARPSLTRLLAQPSLIPRTAWIGSAAPISGRLGRVAAATVPPLAYSIAGQPPP
jgi:hypothetical protein